MGTERTLRVFVADHRVDRLARLCGQLARSSRVRIAGIAHDGAEVVRRVWSHQPDVLLMAPTLPRMDALTTLRYLSKLGALPVLLLADATEVEPALDGLGLGARGITCIDDEVEPPASAARGGGDSALLRSLLSLNDGGTSEANGAEPTVFRVAHRVRASELGSFTHRLRATSPRDARSGALVFVDAPEWLIQPLADRWHRTTPWRVLVAAPGDALVPGHCLLVSPAAPLVPDRSDQPRLTRAPSCTAGDGDGWLSEVTERLILNSKSETSNS